MRNFSSVDLLLLFDNIYRFKHL